MSSRTLLFSTIWIVTALWIITTPLSVSAADGDISLSLAPQSTHIIAKPGASITRPYSLKNLGGPLYIQLSITSPEDLSVLISSPSKNLSQPYLLKHDEVLDFDLSLSLKDTAPIGDIIAQLKVSTLPLIYATERRYGVDISAHLLSEIIISVSGDGTLDMRPRISLFTSKKGQLSYTTDRQDFVLLLQNTGVHRAYVAGTVEITDPAGQKTLLSIPVQAVPSQGQKYIRLSDSVDQILYSLVPEKLSSGTYTAVAKLRIPESDTDDLMMARYSFRVLSDTVFYIVTILSLAITGCIFVIVLKVLHHRTWKTTRIKKSSIVSGPGT